MLVNAEQERTKRQLRLRIGRLRRRIDNRLHAGQREARRLVSWRTYVKNYPGSAVLTAVGAGLALSAGLSAGRLSRWLGLRLMSQGFGNVAELVRQEIERLWTDSMPQTSRAEAPGTDDVR